MRVARERRRRTRARLLDTILATYRGDRARGPAILDEVLEAAEMSKTNFYKYFSSLEAAVGELGERLADEMAKAIVANLEHVVSPPRRLATGFQLFLSRAAIDARWASFVTHGAYLNPGHLLLAEVRNDFERGIATGDYRIEVIDAAVHLTIGAMVEGMRHVQGTPPAPGYVEDLVVMTLRGVGLSTARARSVARAAADELQDGGGAVLPWWPTPPAAREIQS